MLSSVCFMSEILDNRIYATRIVRAFATIVDWLLLVGLRVEWCGFAGNYFLACLQFVYIKVGYGFLLAIPCLQSL